jgi:hypothetical protein
LVFDDVNVSLDGLGAEDVPVLKISSISEAFAFVATKLQWGRRLC